MNPAHQDETRTIGRGMIIAAWVIVLALFTTYFSGVLDHQRNPNQSIQSRVGEDGNREVILKRNRFGHYVTAGEVNGSPVEFMLDTGATDVAIPAGLADRLGLKRGQAMNYRTANGMITGYRTILDSVSIGPLVLTNVPASINPAMKDMEILLGMSVLKQVDFSQSGDALILSLP